MPPSLDEITRPARLSLANLPTRVQPLDRVLTGGPPLFVKRDDETGSDLTGNKVRKLEYLLAEAEEEGADVIVTCGGVQSNHCRATAIAARRLGIDSLLFLRGEEPPECDGNLLLDAMVGAELRFITPEAYARRRAVMSEAADQLRAAGRRPYVIPEGGSNALGSFGYVSLFEELRAQAGPWPWRHLVCAVGSGGTLAGLLIGRALTGVDLEIWGVNVCDSAAYFQARVLEIEREFRDRFLAPNVGPLFDTEAIRILEGYKGPAYAVPFAEELETIRLVARREGLLLDPVYTGKAFHGLLQEAKRGRFGSDGVLFLHTGGAFSLFPYRHELLA